MPTEPEEIDGEYLRRAVADLRRANIDISLATTSDLETWFTPNTRMNNVVLRYTASDTIIDEAEVRPKTRKMTKEIENTLRNSRDLIDAIYSAAAPYRDRDYRDSEYWQLIIQEKNESMSANEIINSESPVLIGRLPADKYSLIITGGHADIDEKEDTFHFLCKKCGLDTPPDFAYFCAGRIYCAEHVPNYEICGACSELREKCNAIITFDGREILVCGPCALRVKKGCRDCGGKINISLIEVMRCAPCIERAGGSGSSRRFSMSMEWTRPYTKGATMQSPRVFSAEIEALSRKRGCLDVLGEKLPSQCGIGGDSSVQDDAFGYRGFEVQTPRLAGARGEELLHRIHATMKQVEAYVNYSCGTHIHLDGKGIIPLSRKEYPAALLGLLKFHIAFEDVISSLIPFARRSNKFCRPLRESFKLSEVDSCESVFELEKLWYKVRSYATIRMNKSHHHHSSRYFGVNFHSLLANGHLEIRHHSGTLNPSKILQWANLHALIMDAAVAKKFTDAVIQDGMRTTDLEEKTKTMFDLIGLSEQSRIYFNIRQKKFSRKNNDEDSI